MIDLKDKNSISNLALLFWLLITLFVPGQVVAETTDPETGRDIFFKHCKACHGVKGDGKTFAANVLNPPPKNFTSEKSKKELTKERMIQSVTEGRKGTAMMPWKSRLTEQEIQAVVNYIRKNLMELEPQMYP
ncbi:MAG: cytochrome c [Nitrospinota bacterium]